MPPVLKTTLVREAVAGLPRRIVIDCLHSKTDAQMGSMIFGKDKMNSYLYRFLLLAVPLI